MQFRSPPRLYYTYYVTTSSQPAARSPTPTPPVSLADVVRRQDWVAPHPDAMSGLAATPARTCEDRSITALVNADRAADHLHQIPNIDYIDTSNGGRPLLARRRMTDELTA